MEGDTMINDTIIDTNEAKPECFWANVLNDGEKCHLVVGLSFNGICSLVLLIWWMFDYTRPNIILGKLKNMRSYGTLLVFLMSSCLRTIVGILSRLDPIKQIMNTWFQRCDILAFLETFFAVFEVEALTHMCIDRYVVAKYITNDWKINVGHYRMYNCLCLFFALLYSVPPLFGLGRYGCDFGNISWTYDMLLPHTWERYLISTVFFLRSFKPAAFMIIMLIWALKLEHNFDEAMKKKADFHFTKFVIVLTLVNLVCWSPIALIRAFLVLGQLLYDDIFIPSSFFIFGAMTIYEATPILCTWAFLIILRHRRHRQSKPVPASSQVCQTGIVANVADENETISKKD